MLLFGWTPCIARATPYKVRLDGKVVTRVLYSVIGLNLHGKKEVLGIYLSESEGAKFCGAARAVVSFAGPKTTWRGIGRPKPMYFLPV